MTEFLRKSVRAVVKFRNFHPPNARWAVTLENTEFYSTFFLIKFRQINVLLKNFTLNWFDGKNLHSVKNTRFFSRAFLAKISWNQQFYYVKKLLSWFDEIFFRWEWIFHFPHRDLQTVQINPRCITYFPTLNDLTKISSKSQK